ncbi:MAG: chemotaxis protein CheR [Alteromonas sp.]|uniref:CheR family methyltransferase n=2 Tax=Alteromonas australica TaxID=589873 RepID=UPI000C39D549|nr:CheR family methyltransferase [Alteromonas australica]MAF71001.1 chemotaxis protein CheR [Alteromonas sp.]MAO29699.1 chemotaxis protein CheR [Alteromonas sp.]HBF70589.1 chemotaxis protein CheR [Alteromonas australica]|tara:strand:+ start:10093 stop:10926 length:834 start_codon:yes stop_codon:yes gene_type:complete
MTAVLQASPVQREFAYSRRDFERVKKLLFSQAGINLADSKDAMVYSRLARRLRVLNISSFKAYLTFVAQNEEEMEHFINALTTNLTAFFREPHHFDALSAYLQANPNVKRIWCAASSTGEEPYSIAMTVASVFGSFSPKISILATDIDSKVLHIAREGVYSQSSIAQLSLQHRQQFFYKGKGKYRGKVKIANELRQMVRFEPLNLMSPSWCVEGPVDIIFCRNVMIYFDRQTQQKILSRMVTLMAPNGMYVAGHSENFTMYPNLVTPMGKTIYRPVT